jgi:hypothetical protein
VHWGYPVRAPGLLPDRGRGRRPRQPARPFIAALLIGVRTPRASTGSRVRRVPRLRARRSASCCGGRWACSGCAQEAGQSRFLRFAPGSGSDPIFMSG